jgi:hypothetical protein
VKARYFVIPGPRKLDRARKAVGLHMRTPGGKDAAVIVINGIHRQ